MSNERIFGEGGKLKAGIIGLGVIGGALKAACEVKGIHVFGWDKYKTDPIDDPFDAVLNTDLIFLCLPTPTINGVQKLGAIVENLKRLSESNYKGVVVIRSTVLPGVTNQLSKMFRNLLLAHCPEFLTAKSPFEDLIKQKAVLISAKTLYARRTVGEFWQEFDPKTPRLEFNDPSTTEMAKYIHNCFLATKVSFFNDIFDLCEAAQINFEAAKFAAKKIGQIGNGHDRVPGPDGERGFGGACFPKDMHALNTFADCNGVKATTLYGALAGNKVRRKKVEDQ